MAKIKLKKNDTVIVTTGNSKGIKGKVIKIFPKENRAMVEGVNLISKHTKIVKEKSTIIAEIYLYKQALSSKFYLK